MSRRAGSGPSHDALVAFALETYGRAGVADSCVLLQDRLGVDVVVLLYAMYLARHCHVILDDQALQDADTRVANWRREVIAPLRSLRRRIGSVSGVSQAMMSPTRQRIKEAELSAEVVAFALLFRKEDGDLGQRGRATSAPLVSRVARFYGSQSGNVMTLRDANVKEAITCLTAAFRA
ncbi:TIGR02444 family protein [Variovorax sp. J22R133]|uniref:TIGR02444 family protein n=1 Tax=Variovorax brevis TaxID=3053503 RepID=UPI002574B566|nr:TIGR02444 family protein [Variovorax sp. J22R133]MDM0117663.1 TIGR02444 family protein [Variovorax sp. J22R133]